MKTETRGTISAIVAVTAWGINAVLLKYLTTQMPTALLNSSRILIASSVFLLLVLIRRRIAKTQNKNLPAMPSNHQTWLGIATLGLVGTSLYQTLFINGIKLANASVAALVGSTNPVWVAILLALLGQGLTRFQSIGIPITMLGVAVLSWQSISASQVQPLGVLLLVGSNLFWAIYTVGSRRFMQNIAPIEFTAFSFVLGGLPYVLFTLPAWKDAPQLTNTTWLLVLLATLLAQVLGFITWFNAISILGATRASIFLNITPLVGVALAAITLGETITATKILAGAIILFGVWLANKQ